MLRLWKRWVLLVAGMAALAIILVVSPALGGPSLKKLVKKEVAKQISKATGPQGPPGAAGAAGTARAYASVQPDSNTACSINPCHISSAKGIASVRFTDATKGLYCIDAPGIDSSQVPVIVSVDWNATSGPEGNASAMGLLGTGGYCPSQNFAVITQRFAAGGSSVAANNVGFDLLIP